MSRLFFRSMQRRRRANPEIDFIAGIGLQRLPIEVKYRRAAPDDRDTAGIRAFCAKPANGAPFGLVITQSFGGMLGPTVVAVPASTFLLLR